MRIWMLRRWNLASLFLPFWNVSLINKYISEYFHGPRLNSPPSQQQQIYFPYLTSEYRSFETFRTYLGPAAKPKGNETSPKIVPVPMAIPLFVGTSSRWPIKRLKQARIGGSIFAWLPSQDWVTKTIKASPWITGPCSRSRHTFLRVSVCPSSYECARVYLYTKRVRRLRWVLLFVQEGSMNRLTRSTILKTFIIFFPLSLVGSVRLPFQRLEEFL